MSQFQRTEPHYSAIIDSADDSMGGCDDHQQTELQQLSTLHMV